MKFKQQIIRAAIILLTVMSSTAFGQSKMSQEQKQELKQKMTVYKSKLNLTAEQSPKVDSINRNYFTALASLKEDKGSRFSKLKKLKALNSDHDQQMKAVLTTEQFATYQKSRAEMKEEIKANRPK